MNKHQLRTHFRDLRRATSNPTVKSNLAYINLKSLSIWQEAKLPMLYYSVSSEIDTQEIILDSINQRGVALLPTVINRDGEMGVGTIKSVGELVEGEFSIPEPKLDLSLDCSAIDVILVPGIAFDRFGGRVGQGGGYYDRFLATLKAVKIGFAYGSQVFDGEIPLEEFDLRVDYVVTEDGVIRC